MTATELDRLPVYERRDVPEELKHLLTMTDLKKQRLKPADGQQPVAMLRVYRRGHGWGEFPLYDPSGAAKMRPLSAKQQAAKTARRTCPECREVRDYVVDRRCTECFNRAQREAQARQERTCLSCRRVSLAPVPVRGTYPGQRCEPCWILNTLYHQFAEEKRARWRRTCPRRDCGNTTATDEEIDAVFAATGVWSPRWCPPCKELEDHERADRQRAWEEAEQRAEETRQQEVAGLEEWARQVLADPDTVILDCESTGLHNEARIVDIGVLSITGEPLLDTLVDPGEAIPAEASDIHGITDADVAGAPSFTAVLEQLTTVLAGRRCLIYNAPYDVGRLRHELQAHYQQSGHSDPTASAEAWLKAVRFEDVMIPYSDWYGDWSDYWGNYAWQPLYGGDHRAISDCRAVVERLRKMGASARP